MSTVGEGRPDTPIDVVYTWVDGDCDDFQADMRHALRAFDDNLDSYDYQPCRYRQNDELRYSLRSLERNARWVRKIHLVTNGQLPEWLKGGSQRIQMVRHEQIFGICEINRFQSETSLMPSLFFCAVFESHPIDVFAVGR